MVRVRSKSCWNVTRTPHMTERSRFIFWVFLSQRQLENFVSGSFVSTRVLSCAHAIVSVAHTLHAIFCMHDGFNDQPEPERFSGVIPSRCSVVMISCAVSSTTPSHQFCFIYIENSRLRCRLPVRRHGDNSYLWFEELTPTTNSFRRMTCTQAACLSKN